MRSSSRSRTAPPTRCTGGPSGSSRSSSEDAPGSARIRASRASGDGISIRASLRAGRRSAANQGWVAGTYGRSSTHEAHRPPVDRPGSPPDRIAAVASIDRRMTPGTGPGARRWLRWVLIVGVVLLVLAGGAVAFVLLHKPGNVSHPNLSFTTTTTTSSTTTTAHKRKVVDTFLWPRYGFDAARTRVFDGPHVPKPPFRVGWRYQDYALLEFPPVIYPRDPVLPGRQRLRQGGRQTHRPQAVGAEDRHARRRLPGSRCPRAPRLLPGALHGPKRGPASRRWPVRGPVDARRSRRVVDQDSPRHRVLADRVREDDLLRRPERDGARARRRERAHALDLSRRRRRQGRHLATPTGSSISATTPGVPTRSAPGPAIRSGR